jgi:YegS/Rv2252/BmrU family lipid kinase
LEKAIPTTSARKFLFVVNPHAGVQGKEGWLETIKTHFEGRQDSYQTMETTGDKDLQKIRAEIDRSAPDVVVSIGGDGTLKMVAEAAAGTQLQICMIPAGSANGMAQELGLPTSMPDLLKMVTGGKVKALDAVQVNDHFSIHLSDIGLNAHMISFFEKGPARGKWGYARAVVQAMRRQRSMQLHITLDEKNFRRRAAMVIIANGRTYGSGVVLDADSTMDDGAFEVIVLREVTLLKVLRCFIRGRMLPGPEVEVFRGKSLQIETSRNVPFQVDGEFIGTIKQLEARILPAAVNMIVPS